MTVSVVRSGQTAGGSANSSLAITAPTAGNLLVAFGSVVGTSATISDNLSGTWTPDPTTAPFGTGADLLIVAYKIATGSETSITLAGSTPEGISYVELSGAIAGFDVTAAALTNQATNTTCTTPAITTTTADLILAAVGVSAGSSTVTMSGTPALTSIGTSGRAIGGYYVPGAPVTAQQFTVGWATSHPFGALVVAIAPSAPPANTGAGFFALL